MYEPPRSWPGLSPQVGCFVSDLRHSYEHSGTREHPSSSAIHVSQPRSSVKTLMPGTPPLSDGEGGAKLHAKSFTAAERRQAWPRTRSGTMSASAPALSGSITMQALQW